MHVCVLLENENPWLNNSRQDNLDVIVKVNSSLCSCDKAHGGEERVALMCVSLVHHESHSPNSWLSPLISPKESATQQHDKTLQSFHLNNYHLHTQVRGRAGKRQKLLLQGQTGFLELFRNTPRNTYSPDGCVTLYVLLIFSVRASGARSNNADLQCAQKDGAERALTAEWPPADSSGSRHVEMERSALLMLDQTFRTRFPDQLCGFRRSALPQHLPTS